MINYEGEGISLRVHLGFKIINYNFLNCLNKTQFETDKVRQNTT